MKSLKDLLKNPSKVKEYGQHFSKPKFWLFLEKISKNVGIVKKILVLYYCMRDPETPKLIRAIILGCLGYLILPADFMPDAIVGIGWLDDLAVLTAISQLASSYIKPVHIEEATKKIPFIK